MGGGRGVGRSGGRSWVPLVNHGTCLLQAGHREGMSANDRAGALRALIEARGGEWMARAIVQLFLQAQDEKCLEYAPHNPRMRPRIRPGR